ncbi:hypothetical protein L9F63_001443, partial [Diploptera punctata]
NKHYVRVLFVESLLKIRAARTIKRTIPPAILEVNTGRDILEVNTGRTLKKELSVLFELILSLNVLVALMYVTYALLPSSGHQISKLQIN